MDQTTAQTTTTQADQEKIAAIRAELPAVREFLYFNTGTNGPLPRRSVDALVGYTTAELERGRIRPDIYERPQQVKAETREKVASLLGCSPREVALTHNTTEGINMALMGRNWQAGDEIICSWTEHPGGFVPPFLLRVRHGVTVHMTQIGLQELDPVEEVRKLLSPRTKAIVLSHVSWSTGMVLPMREIADLAHGVGALVVCDAAQACGMVPSDVYALGVDAYACSGQKWLCGPDGTGALFMREALLADLQQTFIGYEGAQPGHGRFVPTEGVRRFEVGTLNPATVAGFAASLDWLAGDVGWEWAYARIAALGRYCYDTLAAIPGVTMHTPREKMAGLVSFTLEGFSPPELTERLVARDIIIRFTMQPQVNRVATGFYNTEDEIDRLAAAIDDLRRSR